MSVLKSQDYLYFQNKAQHYHNILRARSSIAHPAASFPHTDTHNRDQPYHRHHDILTQNEKLTGRILHISATTLQKQGAYSRYNKFERNFRKCSPKKQEEARLISLANQQIKDKLQRAKARVGNITSWKNQYSQMETHRKHLSRYVEGQRSKRDLTISEEPFLQESYRKFINTIQVSQGPSRSLCRSSKESEENIENSSQKKPHGKKQKRLYIEKLFILPHLAKPEVAEF